MGKKSKNAGRPRSTAQSKTYGVMDYSGDGYCEATLKGHEASQKGDKKAAMAHWMRAAALRPNNAPDAYCNMGMVHAEAGEGRLAELCLRKAVEQSDDSDKAVMPLVNLGGVLSNMAGGVCKPGWRKEGAPTEAGTAMLTEACDLFERAVALDPKSALVRANYGFTLAKLGRTKEAIDHLKEVEGLENRKKGEPESGLGQAARKQLTRLETAIRNDPDYGPNRYKDPHASTMLMLDWSFHPACGFCGKEAKQSLKKCGKCAMIAYCSKDCQTADWKKHREHCKSIASLPTPAAVKKASTSELLAILADHHMAHPSLVVVALSALSEKGGLSLDLGAITPLVTAAMAAHPQHSGVELVGGLLVGAPTCMEDLSVKQLKMLITKAGLTHGDCFEKVDLIARAKEAMPDVAEMH